MKILLGLFLITNLNIGYTQSSCLELKASEYGHLHAKVEIQNNCSDYSDRYILSVLENREPKCFEGEILLDQSLALKNISLLHGPQFDGGHFFYTLCKVKAHNPKLIQIQKTVNVFITGD